MTTNPIRTAIVGILGGAFLLVVYLTCTFISWALYPSAFSPLTNMLSRLGNPLYNPEGAAWYNVGNILTGLGMVPFFIGFSIWRIDGKKNQVLLVKLAQIAGFVDAFSVIMVGIFAEGMAELHGYMGGFYFITNACVLTLAYFAFKSHPQFPRGYSKFCVLVILLYYMNAITLGFVPLAEWLAVFSATGLEAFLLYKSVQVLRKR